VSAQPKTPTTPAKGGATTPATGSATPASPSGSAAPTPAPAGAGAPAPQPDLAAVRPEEMPTTVRMRRLEQKTQQLKEKAWQLKARVQMLKEQTLGGGVGAQASIDHKDQMGASYRLTKLIYSLDGAQVFARSDEAAESMHKARNFDIFAGPISPGNHTLQVVATYRGHGYGVFEYLTKFTFTARGSASFTTGEGKISKVECRGYEKGGAAASRCLEQDRRHRSQGCRGVPPRVRGGGDRAARDVGGDRRGHRCRAREVVVVCSPRVTAHTGRQNRGAPRLLGPDRSVTTASFQRKLRRLGVGATRDHASNQDIGRAVIAAARS